ncbi:MAG: tetratricopeptide repeat protein [Candidatus Bipolaricaulota bacterium]|nr:tetratricopeptide repeat protein [Candidatus Bipolaricaulota bacterium]
MPKRKAAGQRRGASPARPRPWVGRIRFGALLLFLATMPLFFTPWNTEYGYTKSIYTLVFVSLLLVLWAAEVLPRREVRVQLSWLFPVLPGLLLSALLSLTGKTPATVVLQSATLILYFGFIFLLVLNAELGDREVVLVLGALLLAGFATALLALFQQLGWVPGAPEDRLVATMGNRQFVAGFLSYLVLPSGILLFRLRRPWAWVPAVLGVGFVLAVMLLTGQIGVRLGLAVGLAFISFGLGYWGARVGGWPKWAAAGAVGIAALGAVLGPVGLVSALAVLGGGGGLAGLGRLLRRRPLLWIPTAALVVAAVVLLLPVTTPLRGVRALWERQSGAVRAWDLWVGYEMWRDRPLFGVGLGGYKIHFVPYKPAFLASPRGEGYRFPFPRADQAHNEYVQVASELGTVGALVVLGGLGLLAYLGLRRLGSQKDPGRRLELLLLGGGILAVLVHAVPTFPFHLPASSLAFIVLLALALSPRYGPVGDLALRLRGWGLKGAALGISLFAVVVSVIAVRDIVADAHLLAGQVALGYGDLPGAKARFARAVELDFSPRVSLYWLGVAQAQAGEYEAARRTLRACLSRYRPETLYLQLAQVHLVLRETGEARALLGELLATVPPQGLALEARYGLAIADIVDGELVAAEGRLKELVALDPDYEWAHYQLGEVARLRYLWPEARAHYERALAIVQRKEREIRAQQGTAVSLSRLQELRSQETRLRELRSRIEGLLRQLP